MASPFPTLAQALSQLASIQPRSHHNAASTTTMDDTVPQDEARGPHAEGMDTSDKTKVVRKGAEMAAATKEPDVDVEAKNNQASAAETETNTLAATITRSGELLCFLQITPKTRKANRHVAGTMTTDTAQTHEPSAEPVGGKEKLWED